jgi:predicted nucleic acid-binding protein
VFPKPLSFRQAEAFVDGLLRSPSCLVLTETSEHRAELAAAVGQLPRIGGNQLHDLHHAIVMREHGIRDILTCDTDFRLFPWVDIRSLTE